MKENCNTCKYKRKIYKRVELKYYPARFGCSAKKRNYMRVIPAYKCKIYEYKQPEEKNES